MNYRNEKIASLLKKELGSIILKEIEAGDVLVTLMELDLNSDRSEARAKISVIPEEKSKEILKELENKSGYFGHLILKKTRLRIAPKLIFKIDHGQEKAAIVEKLLMQTQAETKNSVEK